MISSNGTAVRASLCHNCGHVNLAGFPAGLGFSPSDQQLIEHLESLVLVKEGEGSRAHPLINYFIQTIEEDTGICYTHPKNLPGVTRDGHSKYFFHRISKAYRSKARTRRKVMSERSQGSSSEDVEEAQWHQTGNARPVIVGGTQKGFKKILVLHNIKQGKRERTNWIMHQYHLGMSEEEKDGELVVSKVFYRCPDATMGEVNDEMVVVVASEATPDILPVSGAAAVSAAAVTMVQPLPAKVFQEAAGVGDLISGDQGKVHGNNHHIPSQHPVQSVHIEPDTTMSVQAGGVGDPVSADQGQVDGNNHYIPSQHHVPSVDSEPDTTLTLRLGTGWSM